jgi:hypothetical protein
MLSSASVHVPTRLVELDPGLIVKAIQTEDQAAGRRHSGDGDGDRQAPRGGADRH